MPTYEHLAECCGHAWEEFYSIKADPPTTCPSCKTEGKVKRLISGGSGVKVELGRDELKADIKKGKQEIQKRIKTDENFRANLSRGGEAGYHQDVLHKERIRENLRNI